MCFIVSIKPPAISSYTNTFLKLSSLMSIFSSIRFRLSLKLPLFISAVLFSIVSSIIGFNLIISSLNFLKFTDLLFWNRNSPRPARIYDAIIRIGNIFIQLYEINKIIILDTMLIRPKNILSAKSLVDICSASPNNDDKNADGPLALIKGDSSIVKESKRSRLIVFWTIIFILFNR